MGRLRRDETGAEAVEFALVGPIALFGICGLIWLLLALAAHLSLAHATSVAVRYAAIPTDPVAGTYPAPEQVAGKLDDATPFFTADRCSVTVTGEAGANAPVVLEAACGFPNPIGAAVSGLSRVLGGGAVVADEIALDARATARRE